MRDDSPDPMIEKLIAANTARFRPGCESPEPSHYRWKLVPTGQAHTDRLVAARLNLGGDR